MDTKVRIVFGKTLARAALNGVEEWTLYLSQPSVAEALRAVNTNVRGRLTQYLVKQGMDRFYKVALGRKDNLLSESQLREPSGTLDIYMLPVAKGRKSGLAKIIAAVAIVAVTWWNPLGWSAAIQTIGYGMAASLALGGITQLLTPTPSFNADSSEGDSRGSSIIEGNSQVITQGGAVGLVYGRALVTPMPISISFTAYDKANAASSNAKATSTTTYGPGGVINQTINPPDGSDNLP